jgi:hypothetical protein
LKKKSKQKIPVLKRKLWKVFSDYIKKRDRYICFTCSRKCQGSGAHAGHFIPKSVGGLALYFDEENVHCQCYNCNINLGGNQYIYGKKLGEEKVIMLNILKTAYTKWNAEVYLEKIEHYKKLND